MKRDIPEVLQTSAMDCGPAALAALLSGHDIRASYGRLREVCQTSVDGTSVDTLADVARRLGLDARQLLLPVEAALDPAHLPALLVIRREDQGLHFVVAWRRSGDQVQVMDPAQGRRWQSVASLTQRLHIHTHVLPAAAWRTWATGPAGRALLSGWMDGLGIPPAARDEALRAAAAAPDWRGAGARFATLRLLDRLVPIAAQEAAAPRAVPYDLWPAHPMDDETVAAIGVVSLVARARCAPSDELSDPATELASVVQAVEPAPWGVVWQALRADRRAGWRLAVVLVAVTAGGLLETLYWRALVDLHLGARPLQWAALVGGSLLAAALMLLRWASAAETQRVGRQLEVRLRVALLGHLPRLEDRYFSSRPISDLAERAHSLHQLRGLPALGYAAVRAVVELTVSTVVLASLLPASLSLALGVIAVGVGVTWLTQRTLGEAAQRHSALTGAVARVGLDALAGGVPLRTHGAGSALEGEYEGLLVSLVQAGRSMQRDALGATAVLSVVTTLGVTALLTLGAAYGQLTLLYLLFAMRLPIHTQQLAGTLLRLPSLRAHLMRLLEPLSAPVAPEADAEAPPLPEGPLAVELEDVHVEASGHALLQGVTLSIRPGEHVAIIGVSGAGKSTLLALLLGWHRPRSGAVRVGGRPLDAGALRRVRARTAWVDPAVQLWNRSLLENLRYGSEDEGADDAELLHKADLRSVLNRLPDGLQTVLGEGGGRLSGGEGQRVRLARALRRPRAGLVLLDEPFRGLDRDARHRLLTQARDAWADATLLCVTHDVSETLGFSRVLVVEGGRVVEDGAPAELRAARGRYAALLQAEEDLRHHLWEAPGWRRLQLDGGRLVERP
jgi:ABC-type bacteriocin/lantibiotic exporter with double-glycine peptidase domain